MSPTESVEFVFPVRRHRQSHNFMSTDVEKKQKLYCTFRKRSVNESHRRFYVSGARRGVRRVSARVGSENVYVSSIQWDENATGADDSRLEKSTQTAETLLRFMCRRARWISQSTRVRKTTVRYATSHVGVSARAGLRRMKESSSLGRRTNIARGPLRAAARADSFKSSWINALLYYLDRCRHMRYCRSNHIVLCVLVGGFRPYPDPYRNRYGCGGGGVGQPPAPVIILYKSVYIYIY